MPVDEPSWWYMEQSDWRARLLYPIAATYGALAVRRFTHGRPFRSQLPVICVGNFTAGGTGKTPLALLIVRALKGRGERPAVLTRGYGGRLSGPRRVDPARDTAAEVGDEALLMAQEAATFVARDRPAGARVIAQEGKERADVIVMDDGLQNPSLAKDLTIAVVDGMRGFGNGRVLPAGPLRAPLEFQLGLADAILVNHPPQGAGQEASAAGEWLRRRFPGPVLDGRPQAVGDTAAFKGARVVAFAGIANPHRFFRLLEALGAIIVERIPFPDHHPFSEADAGRLLRLAAANNAMLATTEKDHVRLAGSAGLRGELRAVARVLRIELALEMRDAERLSSLIDLALKAKRGRAGTGVVE
ncbi:MAG TPA: tetraacyldisaccharide 4'-kinase [Hyphomicrobiaceae bacterium]|nr:tetraacyldisaccharide 4'-kinase [Hyphomicrobiaceae bacterium]